MKNKNKYDVRKDKIKLSNIIWPINYTQLIFHKGLVLFFVLACISSTNLHAQAFVTFAPNPAASTCTEDNNAILCYDLMGTGTNGDGIINSVNIILDDASMSPDLVVDSWGDDNTGDAMGGTYSVTTSPLGNSVLNYADLTGRVDGAILGTVCFTTTSVDGSGDGFTLNVNTSDMAFFPSQVDGINITAENDLLINGSDSNTTPCPIEAMEPQSLPALGWAHKFLFALILFGVVILFLLPRTRWN